MILDQRFVGGCFVTKRRSSVPFNNKAFKRLCEESRHLCADKHQDYGPGNVQKFGIEGMT